MDNLVNEFRKLPWGSKSAASYDIRVSNVTVSQVLNKRFRREDILIKLEEWVKTVSLTRLATDPRIVPAQYAQMWEFAEKHLIDDEHSIVHIDEFFMEYLDQMTLDQKVPLSPRQVQLTLMQKYKQATFDGERYLVGVKLLLAPEVAEEQESD